MKLTVVRGRAGCGKSRYVANAVRTAMRAGQQVIMIVPDQYTLEAERELLSEENTAGLMQAEVFSFSRLCQRVLEQVGRPEGTVLDARGRSMVISRVMAARQEDLCAYGRYVHAPLFAAALADQIAEFKRFAVPPQALQAVGSARLQDIALLYQGYQEAMAGLYTDTEDQMNWMIERIPDAPMIRGAAVFIDGFEMLTTQIYRAVRALIQTADSVTITFRLGLETDPDAPIFETEERHLARVLNIAREEGAAIETVFLPNAQFQPRHDRPALRHLERSLYDMSAPAYPHPPKGLRIIGCTSPVQEAEMCARLVWESVRDQGLRFREIAVLTADISAYGALLQQAFRRYGIPCFLDTKRTVGTHPLSRYLLQSLRAISLGFRAEEVLALSKTAFCALDMDEADELDELVKACGVRYLAPGTRIYSQAKREQLNPLREKLLSGQYQLRKALSNAQSAQAQAKALAEFLEYDGLIDRINAESARLQSCGEYEADAELRQVYQAISSMLVQIHNVLGGAPLSLRAFYDQLSAGLFAQEIGVLPATVDAVQVGTVARSLPGRTRTLILLGVNEGVLPAAILEDGLLTKQDQKKLTDSGVFMGNTPEQRAAEEELALYTVLSTPKQNLVLTYAKNSAAGKVMQPSSLISQIRALFPLLEEEQMGQAPEDLLQTEQSSILPLAAALRTTRETGAPLPAPYHQALSLLSGHLAEPVRRYWAQQSAPEDNIGPTLAASLYTLKDTMGVTALETYAACPFRYFAEKALLEPRGLQPFGHTGMDRGTYCHEVMDQYLTYLRRAQWAPETVTREQCDALVDRLCDEYEASVYLAEDYGQDGRSLHDASATRRRMRESCWQATRHLVNGTFRPVRMEQQFDWRFDLKDGTPQTVRGRIDRVDKADTEDGTLVRVLDYKTGRDKFAYGDLYAGTALQLPLYAGQAARRLNGAQVGLFYAPIPDTIVNKTPDLAEQARAANARLSGPFTQALVEAVGNAAEELSHYSRGREQVLLSPDEMAALTRYAEEKAIALSQARADGVTAPKPEQTYGDGCAYCSLRGCCGQDRRPPKDITMKKEEFFTRIGEGGGTL